jgi:hypothetical protein
MAKGQIVTAEVENRIVNLYRAHPKWKAPRVRDEVESELREKAVKEHKSIAEGFPSLSTVQKILAIERKPGSVEDGPWNISTLVKYPIPAAAVPVVLDVSMQSEPPLTIREAKWIGRLYVLIAAIVAQQGGEAAIAFIRLVAGVYASSEKISEVTGRQSPSTMDKVLWGFLTARESMDEVAKRGFDPGDDDDRFRKGKDGKLYYGVTTKELNRLKKMQRSLDPSKPFDGFAALGLTLEVKESEK